MKLTWEQIEETIAKIAEQIKYGGADLYTASIVGIGRGGAIPAVMLAHALDIKQVDYINYSRKTGLVASSLQRFSNHRNGMDSLILIDDVTETGGTFKDLVLPFSGKYRTAVLFKKRDSAANITYVGDYFDNEAPSMPWEK